MPGRKKRVALLATGNEIISGEITNSNGQEIAQRLSACSIAPGMHLSCDDNLPNLEQSLDFLWQQHDAVITIGGLGPTSDDLTREAIANVLKLPLCFDEASWQRIIDRFAQVNVVLTDNNRQQAYFPQSAKVIINPYGSASGCEILHQQRWLFMLPGPPNECLPLFEEQVLPKLVEHHFAHNYHRKRWQLKGISESHLAEKVDSLMQNNDASIAYCSHKPFIDLTLEAEDKQLFLAMAAQIDQIVTDYVVDNKGN